MTRYLIGIDLGTTNSALAYIDTQHSKGGKATIRPFPIPQLVAAGETAPRELLPSFLYLPGEHDLPAGAIALPWDADSPFAVGEFARHYGARVPGRLHEFGRLEEDQTSRCAPGFGTKKQNGNAKAHADCKPKEG
jgi:molecular chaperone DnaK (HSP70)